MSGNGRLITVSNRVAMPNPNRPAAGGLAVGVLAALEDEGGVWFGWDGKLTASDSHDPQHVTRGNITFSTIDLNEREYELYYNGFSNRVLWPLFHYLLSYMLYDRREFEAYLRVNALFARKLKPLLEPDDIIWVHDYHLIPLAAELRNAGVDQPIGFFLHVPFPGYDVLQALPDHEYLLRSLSAYDVVGFQTERDLASFREAMTHPVIGGELAEGNRIDVPGGSLIADVYPIGIDVDGIATLAEANKDTENVQRMRSSLGNRELLIGVDRLDYSKGLRRRFQAYERLLERYPSNQGNLVFMQIAPPTRVGIRAYEEIRAQLERTAGQINGRFADMDWVPIRYLNKGFDRPTLMGMLRSARVGLVTPIRDGMNLVAKEYLASQDAEDPGVLVLSKLAGAAHELTEAVLVNPYDTEDVADGINRSLHMPADERRERHAAMLETLRRNDITAWRTRFVADLRKKRQ